MRVKRHNEKINKNKVELNFFWSIKIILQKIRVHFIQRQSIWNGYLISVHIYFILFAALQHLVITHCMKSEINYATPYTSFVHQINYTSRLPYAWTGHTISVYAFLVALAWPFYSHDIIYKSFWSISWNRQAKLRQWTIWPGIRLKVDIYVRILHKSNRFWLTLHFNVMFKIVRSYLDLCKVKEQFLMKFSSQLCWIMLYNFQLLSNEINFTLNGCFAFCKTFIRHRHYC